MRVDELGYGGDVANPRRRVPDNVPGDPFVDDTCIDGDACRRIAPAVLDRCCGRSRVDAQPKMQLDRHPKLASA